MQKDETLMSMLGEGAQLDRRGFLRGFAALGALTGVGLAGCRAEPEPGTTLQQALPTPVPRLRAAFSHNGLSTIWNQRGRDTARLLGNLLGIDVVSYDGELSVDKQRSDLEAIAEQEWDFVVVHPLAVNAFNEQVRRITSRGIPLIDIDTRLADDLDELGVSSYLEPDNIWMAEQVTMAIIEAVQSDSFSIIHTQGLLTHTGAQGRAQGFRNVLARYPNIRVVDDSPADWDIDKVTALWDRLLEEYPDVRAGFLHNDEMALASLRSITRARKQGQIVVGGIDGMQPACHAVARGELVATVINPTGRIHGGALWVGYFLATRGERADVPRFIRIDGGVVRKENAEGYLWLGDNLLI
jgi:ribose transport system substrate-binding protein